MSGSAAQQSGEWGRHRTAWRDAVQRRPQQGHFVDQGRSRVRRSPHGVLGARGILICQRIGLRTREEFLDREYPHRGSVRARRGRGECGRLKLLRCLCAPDQEGAAGSGSGDGCGEPGIHDVQGFQVGLDSQGDAAGDIGPDVGGDRTLRALGRHDQVYPQ
jgi:hypothetical protein